MGWASKLTYQEVAATGIHRTLSILAFYGDVAGVTEVLAGNPALADDPPALQAAAENGQESIVRLLLQYQPRLAERIAIVARTRELTELLFRSGMNPNLRRWLGVTPLHRFAEQGDVERTAVFLDHGADSNARDEEFCTTPLGYAAMSGKLRMVQYLLRKGVKPGLPDDLAWATPAALASYKGHHEIVRVLETSEATGVPAAYDLSSVDSLVNDVIVAFETGEADAYFRVIDHFYVRRPMAWDKPHESIRISRMRRFVRNRLSYVKSVGASGTLDTADAELLIARSYGFESRSELEMAR